MTAADGFLFMLDDDEEEEDMLLAAFLLSVGAIYNTQMEGRSPPVFEQRLA